MQATIEQHHLPFTAVMRCSCEGEEARGLSSALKMNTTLTKLDLTGNEIGNEGIAAIGEMLKSNNTLKSLQFTSNGIEDQGVDQFSEAMKSNRSLMNLHLCKNDITDVGGRNCCLC